MTEQQQTDTRAELMRAARKIFALHGFDGATVKELAEEAGVNVSLISYHFDGKEGLYRACLEEFGLDSIKVSERIVGRPPSSLEDFRIRLSLFIEEFIAYHLDHAEITTIVHREMCSDNAITKDLFQNIFIKNFTFVNEFVKGGQAKNILRTDLVPELISSMFMGALVHNLRIDPLRKEITGQSITDPKYRETLVHHLLEITLEGAREKKGQSS